MHLFLAPDDDPSPPVVAADVAISLINERYLIVQPGEAATVLRERARLRAAKGLAVSEKRAVKLYAGWATPRPECFVAAG
jgi:hypothetical protein